MSKGTISGFRVSGGRLENKYLTSKLDESVYAAGKAVIWLRMLKEKQIPKKWFRATRNGTKISFVYPQTQAEMDVAAEEYKTYVRDINEKYNLGIEILPANKQGGGESA